MSDTIGASEIEALLRELEGVIGSSTATDATNQRPFSGIKRGTSNMDVAVSRCGENMKKTQFSTYTNTTAESPSTVVPLWERLSPLKSIESFNNDGAHTKGAASLSCKTFLRPKLIGSTVGASLRQVSIDKEQDNRNSLNKDTTGLQNSELIYEQESSFKKTFPLSLSTPSPTASGGNVLCTGKKREEGYREVNFLPIMCARYINPVGLTPRACWGHTLTPVHGHKLLLFGGMSINDGETASLFEYDTSHVSWEPVFVAGNMLPSPRTNHAACASGGRWLYISGGTTARGARVVGDLYCYDTLTQEWKCLWEYNNNSTKNKNEPTPRFGHSMLFRDDCLFIFGGKTVKGDQGESRSSSSFTLASSDVYVFSLTMHKWKKRISTGKGRTLSEGKTTTTGRRETEATYSEDVVKNTTKMVADRRINRCFHAACILGDFMYINGGIGDNGVILDDTWVLDFKKQHWILLHNGNSVDAFPRERHHMFACGEALLVVGGCSSCKGTNSRMTLKYHNFVSVLPLNVDSTPNWIPVAMGNASIVSPNKKSFGAAFSCGFVHVFGGICGSEPATNSMVRFLAADGYFLTDSRATVTSNVNGLTSMMRHLRESSGSTMLDTYILPRSWDGETAIDTLSSRPFGVHRVLVQHRAPKFWEDLLHCRTENVKSAGNDIVGALAELGGPINNLKTSVNIKEQGGTGVTSSHAVAYYTEGNLRVRGLSQPLSATELQCLLDYIYWGDMRQQIFLEHEEEEEDDELNKDIDNLGLKSVIQEEVRTLRALRRAAETYELYPLIDICDAALASNRKKLKQARDRSTQQLQTDLLSLLENKTNATVTVLFVDPHTKQQVVHFLHPFMLMAANSFFNNLLRPLVSGEKMNFQLGPVAAKMKNSNRSALQSRRGILVGPVYVPFLAVQPLLRYFYTQQLIVPREAVFATMLGSHLLDVSSLQAYCESILAREEVNYYTACEFYSLAGKYGAAMLQETALLTAVLGYAEVSHSPGYKALSEREAQEIDAVAIELETASWTAPPRPVSEVKPTAVYKARWNASIS